MGIGPGVGFVGRLRYIASPVLSMIWVPTLYYTISSLSIILALWEAGDMTLDAQEKLPEGREVFDFIIVGAGSAGSVVAYRLSKNYKVLLLEAGGEPNPLQYIPGFAVFLTNKAPIDWQHKSVPQKFGSLNSINQQSSWSAGRGLGGTGNLNYMIHLRGHTQDFDNWARITGDPSWSWAGVLPYYKSIEDYDEGGDETYHGIGGPLRVGLPDYVGLGPEFVKAGQEFGYPSVDFNAPFHEGFEVLKYPIRHGIRDAPYRAFLQPIRRRSNLVIRKFSHATKVLLNERNEAEGVEYDRHGERRVAFARKEVILSAGAITTPRILMLSGIGPAAHLQQLGIPVRRDLPVGHGLQDHIGAYLGPFFIDKPRTLALERDLTPGAFVNWFTSGRGVLSSPGAHAAGMVSSSYAAARGEATWPDLVLYLFGFSVFRTFGDEFSKAFSLKLDEQRRYYEHAVGKESFLIAVSGARPFSTGQIKLGGSSPYDALVIDPAYLTDEGDVDVKVLVDGIKKTLRLIENSTTLGKEMNARFTDVSLPGCEHYIFRSDAYWECFARRSTVTLHHPVGTCGMGRVVDTQLRVYGTPRLRIIDNSIQPIIVTTNTQASALMIGEKGVDMILKYWENEHLERMDNTSFQYGEAANMSSSLFRITTDKKSFSTKLMQWHNLIQK
ncbi:glucose dehydrogenase [FAD, quinone] [Folsomia candida]|uniref:glucose dehydrogenase [FAD, quinone] n=1 Tax=Folsomia candida TaxID=158441 RepID=UPI001604C656|nr:glucose dehydrogenase [FAD, quinone] [Folsomia candida]